MRSSTLVAGGGIAGLSFAERLLRLRPEDDIRVIEASPQPGGLVRTEREAGYVEECGPETILDDGSGLSGLLADLGIDRQVIGPEAAAAERFLVHRGKLHALPKGPGAFLRTPLLPLASKLGIFLEPLRRRGRDPEETFASFIARRFSRPVLERFAEPFASGIHAGVPERMEVASCFPRLWAAEQEHGSVLRGLRKSGGMKQRIIGFPGGNEDLVAALGAALGDRILCGREAVALRRVGDGFEVVLGGGDRLRADRLVLAVPGGKAADLLRPLHSELADEVAAVRFVSLASVHVAFPEASVPPDIRGFGFLVPRSEATSSVLGVLYSSDLFAGRAGTGNRLFRAMLGGARHPGVLDASDDGLVREVCALLRSVAGIAADPAHVRVRRHPSALPLYEPGHQARLRRIDDHLAGLPGLWVCGHSYRGSGVATCIRDARRLAERVAAAAATAA